MTEENQTPYPATDDGDIDDTEGHVRRGADDGDEDDTEGHQRR